MSQVQAVGGTGQVEGEVDHEIVPSLREWLVKNNLGDVCNHIESQFKQMNCKLTELLGFCKQDLVDFAKDDLKLKSPLKRNRFVNGVLRLQGASHDKANGNGNDNRIILSERENNILIDLQSKLKECESISSQLKSDEKEIENSEQECLRNITAFYNQLLTIITESKNETVKELSNVKKIAFQKNNHKQLKTKQLTQKLVLCKDECNNIIYNANLNNTIEQRKRRLEELEAVINKANIQFEFENLKYIRNHNNNNNNNNNNNRVFTIRFDKNVLQQIEKNLKTASQIERANLNIFSEPKILIEPSRVREIPNASNRLTYGQGKPHLGIVTVGHVDAGKSTTTGRLLFELGGISQHELETAKQDAQELGKESFLFAFFMDKNQDERERGVTMACTTREFFTESYHYTIIDAPGHRDFIKNMISGASQAAVALLMVPANKGAFETSIAKGNHKRGEIQGQTRQHARLCHLLGIKQLIVGVNKMDDKSVNYSQGRYNEIRTELEKILTTVGYKTKKIPFIPMSGCKGENLCKPSENMPWWKGFQVKIQKEEVKGITLIDALEKVVRQPKRPSDKPFRMPVSDVYKIKGVGDVIAGRIEQGKIVPGVDVRFYPSGVKGKAFSVEMHHKNVIEAVCGDIVGVNVKGLAKDNMPRVGDVMCIDDPKSDPYPPNSCEKFTALVFVENHPGQLKCSQLDQKRGGYKGGFTPSIHIRTAKAPCQMVEIAWKMGKSTNNVKVDSPPYIEDGDQAEVTFMPRMPLVVCSFEECEPLGRFAVMDSNSLIMIGKVISVEYKSK